MKISVSKIIITLIMILSIINSSSAFARNSSRSNARSSIKSSSKPIVVKPSMVKPTPQVIKPPPTHTTTVIKEVPPQPSTFHSIREGLVNYFVIKSVFDMFHKDEKPAPIPPVENKCTEGQECK